MKIPIYKYNKNKLEYEKLEINTKNIFIFIGIQIVMSIFLIYGLSFFFNTPKENKLKRENNDLKQEFFIIDRKATDVIYLLTLLERKDSVIYSSLFTVETVKNKFVTGYIAKSDSGFNDTITRVGDKLGKIEMMLEFTNYKFKNFVTELTNSNVKLQHTPAIQPISNKNLEYTSSGFGLRIHPIYKIRKFHYGMDFVGKVGTPIYATADGTVVVSDHAFGGYGNHVIINHAYNYQTIYGHMDEILVKKNQIVKRGQIIGTLGNTGLSTGAHLHYEVLYMNKPVNPINYYFNDLTADQYEEMLNIVSGIDKSMD
jgi:murein DD-endopeptidase MepM/ murein hydrolase activator NlpD